MEIRKVTTEEELFQVGRLRYDIFVKESKYELSHADHTNKTALESLDQCGQVFAAWDKGKVVGTIRGTLFRNCTEENIIFVGDKIPLDLNRYDLGFSNGFAIAHSYRRTPLACRLASAAYLYGLEKNLTHDIIYCLPEMTHFYKRFGHQTHKENVIHPEYGNVSVMVLSIQDEKYLKGIRSPFYRVLKAHKETQLVHV